MKEGATDFGIYQTTVSKTVHKIAQKIFEKADRQQIRFPSSASEMELTQLSQIIPTTIAIDCTHIDIKKLAAQYPS